MQAPEPAEQIVAFWRDAGSARWFMPDAQFDETFRTRFLAAHEAAAAGALDAWLETPHGALALVILLDQFPRNAFRGTPRMYATDEAARAAAEAAIAAGHDLRIPHELRLFMYLPFEHSEDLDDQERSVALARALGGEALLHAEKHRELVQRFGRFPHRNAIRGRDSTPEEQKYLDEGGYPG